MRARLGITLLLAAVVAVGCGTSPKTTATTTTTKAAVVTAAPQSAIIPEVKYPNGEVKTGAFSEPAGVALTFAVSSQHIDATGLRLLRDEEGFVSCPYQDVTGVWTVGIGEAFINPNNPWGTGHRCESESEAIARLKAQIEYHYEWPVNALNVSFTQNQRDALIDFDYNLGAYIFDTNPSLKYDLQHRDFYAATRQMLDYDRAGGRVNSDLARRRQHEVTLFLTPEPKPAPKPSRSSLLKKRNELRILLADHRCRVTPHGRGKYHHACAVWKAEGNSINRELR